MKKQNFNFYVLCWNWNSKTIEHYDVVPYFIDCWKAEKKKKNKTWSSKFTTEMPKTIDEVKEFLLKTSQYRFWSRCEYELLITGFPQQKDSEVKIDVHHQIKMNIDILANLFYNYIS